jgi:hypothetical protein
MATNTENDQQQMQENGEIGIMQARFKAHPKEGKLFLEIVDKLCACEQFEGMPGDEIIQLFWGAPREDLDKLIKKANKREKKEIAKFTPEGLTKPSTANILFQRQFKADCDKKGIKFNIKDSTAAYKALSEKDRAKYVKDAENMKAEYKKEFERQRAAAIKSGAFPEDKPKRPITAYLRYLNVVRAELMAKHKANPNKREINTLVAKDSGEMWKALSDKEKAKYISEFEKEKVVYDVKLKAWKDSEVSRCKKKAGEVVIESNNKEDEPAEDAPEPAADAPEPVAAAPEPAKEEKKATPKKTASTKNK